MMMKLTLLVAAQALGVQALFGHKNKAPEQTPAFLDKARATLETVGGKALKKGAATFNTFVDQTCPETMTLADLNAKIGKDRILSKYLDIFPHSGEFLYFYYSIKEFIKMKNKKSAAIADMTTNTKGKEVSNGPRRAAFWCWWNKVGGIEDTFKEFVEWRKENHYFNAKALGQATWKTVRSSANSVGKKLSGLRTAATSRLRRRRNKVQQQPQPFSH